MTKKAPLYMELGIGLILTSFVVFGTHKKFPLFETLNFKSYDLLLGLRKPQSKTDQIALVEIDENAVAQFGRWPWPRSLVAQLIDNTVSAGAQVIGLNIIFAEADQNQGLEEINQLQTKFSDLLKQQRPLLARKKVSAKPFEEFLTTDLAGAKDSLDGDSILAQSIEQAVNVVLPMYFQPGDVLGNNLAALPAFFTKEKANVAADLAGSVSPGNAAVLPVEPFGQAALAIGQSNLIPDSDGTLRRIAPFMRYGPVAYPSFALQVVREFLKLERSSLQWKTGEPISLFKAKIPVDENSETYLEFAGPAGTFKRYSAVDVFLEGIPEGALKNKIVLLGVTAPGLADTFVTPSGERFTGLEIWATHIENILSQHFITRPVWARKAEWGFVALAALIVLLLPVLKARIAIPLAAVAFVGTMGTGGFLLIKQGMWVSPTYGATLLALGFAVLVGKRLMFTERRKELVEAEGVETNKMLGLSFQGQGMLDLAFEKFRKCPMDDAMKDLLYNLGLDMERKRQFTKAAAVYEHIATVDTKFKDIGEKIELLKKAGEGAVFGGIGKKGNDATVVVEGLGQHTTLGRYEVMKELGRGAMGIVYLGKDPKINRQVAIKTLRFEEDMDETQTKSVKERFFREAESAGNLTHPSIIRIFDAGEDQDVAYIAMELLDGKDLKNHCEKTNLLPIERAIDIVAHVASGLDYAHKQGVVHRDIKPANIMLLKDGTLRITDFGIARIQATSKTATGAVLGTPAYMSPEQVNGKKVDGRADIFSLGVTLFELLTGEKPFAADSIAALLYRIANVDHTDPREYNPNVPMSLIAIINKALAKNPDQRYQTAGEMEQDLKKSLQASSAETTPMPVSTPAALVAQEASVVAPLAPKPIELKIEAPTPADAIKTEVALPKEKPAESTMETTAPAEPPPSFLSELEEAFNEVSQKTKETPPNNDAIDTLNINDSLIPKGSPPGHDTMIIPPANNEEKTVVIEHNFDDDQEQNKKAV